MKCPKCGCRRGSGDSCDSCGIYFHKYERAQQRKLTQNQREAVGLLWQMNDAGNLLYKTGRFLLLIGLLWLSWGLVFSPIDYWQGNAASRSFLHSINLPFHEFGHIMFRAFGRFMASLGGSLGQLLMPLICLAVFLVKTRDAFAASVAMWWFGESLLDLVAYINDAIALSMPLLGGNEGSSSPYGFHDWEFILTEAGLLHSAGSIAQFVHIMGSFVMGLAMIWMLLLLLRKR